MKLTNTMRNAIQRRILDKVKAPREEALRSLEQALAARLLKLRYGDDVFQRCREIPEGWLPRYKLLQLDGDLLKPMPKHDYVQSTSLGRMMVHVPKHSLELAEHVPLPHQATHGWNEKIIHAGVPEYGMLYDWCAGHAELAEELEGLERQIRATLNSFTTVEKLSAGWPEGYAELPQDMLAVAEGLPAPRIADLNERIAAAKNPVVGRPPGRQAALVRLGPSA